MEIEVSKLTKIFQPKTEFSKVALDNISFKINKNEIIAIIGPNGSGKSTLMSIITGIEKPTKGLVELSNINTLKKYEKNRMLNRNYKNYLKINNANDIESKKEWKKSKINNSTMILDKTTKRKKQFHITEKIAMSFQNPNLQIFKSTVINDVSFSLKNRGIKKEAAELEAKNMLLKLNIKESFFNRSPFTLSGGEKRKLILASLLVSNPQILVFDEPTANLDEESSKTFMNILKDLNEKEKKTIIFITHNLDIVKNFSKRVIKLNKGKIIFDLPTKKAKL